MIKIKKKIDNEKKSFYFEEYKQYSGTNLERKFDNSAFSKSVKILGKNSYLNKIFIQIADKGINI